MPNVHIRYMIDMIEIKRTFKIKSAIKTKMWKMFGAVKWIEEKISHM